MAIYDNNGTASYEIGKVYDNDGTTSYQIGKVYDNDGTTDSLIYEVVDPLKLFSGSLSNWTVEHGRLESGAIYAAAGSSTGGAINYWWKCNTTWTAGTYDTLTIKYGGNKLHLYWLYSGGGNSGYIGLDTTSNWYTTTTKTVSVPANAKQLWLRISVPDGKSVALHSATLSKT